VSELCILCVMSVWGLSALYVVFAACGPNVRVLSVQVFDCTVYTGAVCAEAVSQLLL
jgi:hypothetical protein